MAFINASEAAEAAAASQNRAFPAAQEVDKMSSGLLFSSFALALCSLLNIGGCHIVISIVKTEITKFF